MAACMCGTVWHWWWSGLGLVRLGRHRSLCGGARVRAGCHTRLRSGGCSLVLSPLTRTSRLMCVLKPHASAQAARLRRHALPLHPGHSAIQSRSFACQGGCCHESCLQLLVPGDTAAQPCRAFPAPAKQHNRDSKIRWRSLNLKYAVESPNTVGPKAQVRRGVIEACHRTWVR